MFQKSQKRSITKILELFSEIPESVSASVLSMGRFRNFPIGEVLFCLGDPVKEVFLLIQGRVKTTQVTKNGEEVILRLESPGDLIGVLGADPQGTHNSTAQAIEESAQNSSLWHRSGGGLAGLNQLSKWRPLAPLDSAFVRYP